MHESKDKEKEEVVERKGGERKGEGKDATHGENNDECEEKTEEEKDKTEDDKPKIIPAAPSFQRTRARQMFQDGIRAIYAIHKPEIDVDKVLANVVGKEEEYYVSCCEAWGPPHAPKQYPPGTKRGEKPYQRAGSKQECPPPKQAPTPVPEPAKPPRWLTDGYTWVPTPPPKPAVPPAPWWPPTPPSPIRPKAMPQTAPAQKKQSTATDLGAKAKAPIPKARTNVMHEHDHVCIHECAHHGQQLAVC